MKKIRFVLAVVLSKIIYALCRIFGSTASSAPGKFALMVCPDIVERFASKITGKLIVVCGTNGKTTTNNLIYNALSAAGHKTVCNAEGANMFSGIAATFCKYASLFGSFDTEYACIETDEANLSILFRYAKPDIIVVTNLFRDQLDRYGEIDLTAKMLQKAFDMVPDAALVLNADDPVTSVFGKGRKEVYYLSMEKADIICCDEVRDGQTCPDCGSKLEYDYYVYGQIGKFHCSNCGYKNQSAAYSARNIKISDAALEFEIVHGEEHHGARSGVCAIYNVYNMLTAYAVVDIVGAGSDGALSVICSQKPKPGRMSKFKAGDKTVYLILSKNPTGFNQSVMSAINDNRKKGVLLGLNDLAQDGKDVSWIWDVDFEALLRSDVGNIEIVGMRRYDMYLRLKYAGGDEDIIDVHDSMEEAIDAAIKCDCEAVYMMVNYSTMLPAYNILSSMKGCEEL